MNDNFPRSSGFRPAAATTVDVHNRVLRNTYWLLALSMIPTIVGAWVGLQTGFGVHQAGVRTSSMPTFMVFIAMFGLIFAIQRYRNSGVGVGLLLGFTFLAGVLLSSMLSYVLAMSNGVTLVMLAFGGTALTFAAMASIAHRLAPRFFVAWQSSPSSA